MTRKGVSAARDSNLPGGTWKTVFRRLVPVEWRRRVRLAVREGPVRAIDLAADIRETLVRPRFPLPPPRLRRRVGGTSARRAFERIGLSAAEETRRALERSGVDAIQLERWLDFGCGSGRMARHVAAWPFVRELWGVDVDGEAIDWMRRHCPGHWSSIDPSPPTALASEFFDAAYAISVFTHLDEPAGNAWLAEIHRVLKPGGLLIASTSAPDTS